MAVELLRSVYFAAHKTGSIWTRAALRRAKLARRMSPDHHGTPEEVHSLWPSTQRKWHFATVRNPVTWYISLWSCRVCRKKRNLRIMKYLDKYFDRWIRRCLRRHPGFLTRYYARYFGRKLKGMDFVLHQETLTEDLIKALHRMGERFNPERIRKTPIHNTADPKLKAIAKYKPKTLARLIRRERRIFHRFRYSKSLRSYSEYIYGN